MQWKLIRDQVTGGTGKTAALARQVQEIMESVKMERQQTQNYVDRKHSELLTTLEGVREEWRQEWQQISERVLHVAQEITTERNLREVAGRAMEKQFQGLRDAFEVDQSARKGQNSLITGLIEDVRQEVEEERRSREQLAGRHESNLDGMKSRFEVLSQSLAQSVEDVNCNIKRVSAEASRSSQSSTRLIGQTRADTGAGWSEAAMRLKQLEDRCSSVEERVRENITRQAAGFERLSERNEKTHHAVEEVRLQERLKSNEVEELMARIRELENCFKQRELEAREGRLSSTAQALVAHQQKHIEELESRFQVRHEPETPVRTQSVAQAYDNMGQSMGSARTSRSRLHSPPPLMSPKPSSTASMSPTVTAAMPGVAHGSSTTTASGSTLPHSRTASASATPKKLNSASPPAWSSVSSSVVATAAMPRVTAAPIAQMPMQARVPAQHGWVRSVGYR